MEKKVKIILIALIAILALSFFLTFQAYISKETVARERNSLKIDNESLVKKANDALGQSQQLQNRIKALSADLELVAKEKAEIQNKLDLVNKEKRDLVEQLGALKLRKIESTQRALLPESAKFIKGENKFLRRKFKTLNSHKVDLESRLVNLQEKNDALNKQLFEMESMLKERISKTETLKPETESNQTQRALDTKKESVELPPIVVRPQKSSPASQEIGLLIGRVVAINRDNNFIIVNLGEDSGLKIGNTFTVYRQNQPIAEVSVIQTRKDISACDIKNENEAIKLGDTVK